MGCNLKQNDQGKAVFEQKHRKGEGVSLVNTQGQGNMFQVLGMVSELAKAGWSSGGGWSGEE